MPLSPPKPCRTLTCSILTHTGYCSDHQPQRWQHGHYRGSAASRGYDRDWQHVRLLALQRDKYLCQHCLTEGRITSAIDVDHIIPLSAQGNRLDLSNLQSLCRACHRTKTSQDTKLYAQRPPVAIPTPCDPSDQPRIGDLICFPTHARDQHGAACVGPQNRNVLFLMF